MLRITRKDDSAGTSTLLLEGRLTVRGLAELDAAIGECRHDRRRIVLDLAGLGFLDDSGAAALVTAEKEEVELVGASPFVRELLQEALS